MEQAPSTQECCWSVRDGEHNPNCANYEPDITINHHVNGQPSHVTYFTKRGIDGPRVERNTRYGTVTLVGEATNVEFSTLVTASESDYFSVKGSW